jgi:tetratricopeptide (TPR) repeat protein
MAINREKVLESAQKFVEKQKYDKAILELRRVVEADPSDARTLHKIGELQAKQGLHTDAINTFETVGRLYADGGFIHKAVAVYKQIREMIAAHVPQLAVRYGHIAPRLADLYRQIGLTSDALALLQEVANDLQRQGKDGDALEVYRKIAELDPQNPLHQLRVAEALSRARDVGGAVAAFSAAATLLLAADRRDDAIQVLERLLQHHADPQQAWTCAHLYLARNRLPNDAMQALAKLQVCMQASPQDVNVLGQIARAFELIGQRDKANGVHAEIARISRMSRPPR